MIDRPEVVGLRGIDEVRTFPPAVIFAREQFIGLVGQIHGDEGVGDLEVPGEEDIFTDANQVWRRVERALSGVKDLYAPSSEAEKAVCATLALAAFTLSVEVQRVESHQWTHLMVGTRWFLEVAADEDQAVAVVWPTHPGLLMARALVAAGLENYGARLERLPEMSPEEVVEPKTVEVRIPDLAAAVDDLGASDSHRIEHESIDTMPDLEATITFDVSVRTDVDSIDVERLWFFDHGANGLWLLEDEAEQEDRSTDVATLRRLHPIEIMSELAAFLAFDAPPAHDGAARSLGEMLREVTSEADAALNTLRAPVDDEIDRRLNASQS